MIFRSHKYRPEPLVSREMLLAMLERRSGDGPNDLDAQRMNYMETRWISMVLWWHRRSTEAKWKHTALRLVVVAGGVTIPVLSAIAANDKSGTHALLTAAAVAAAVAAAAAWESVGNYGEIWREKRRAAELLKVEGWLFLNKSGRYRDEKSLSEAFPAFVGEVEKMIAAEVGQYLALFDATLERVRKTADEIGVTAKEVNPRISDNNG